MAITPTGAIFKSLTFDGEDSRDYGVYISGEAVYNAPERTVDMISIPGRNGALALDQGRFENIEVTYPAGIYADSEADFREAVSDFRNALCSRTGYARLTDEYHPDEFRMAVYRSGLEVDPESYKRAGEFNISFECKPQRFLTIGETAEADPATLTNPTLFPSKPLIEVVGYGTLTIGAFAITITGTPGQDIFIDCETLEAYTEAGGIITSMNDKVAIGNQTPVLVPGANTITATANITAYNITPRWWRI